jgi:hypothetical protein
MEKSRGPMARRRIGEVRFGTACVCLAGSTAALWRCDLRSGGPADNQIHLVDVEQLRIDGQHRRWI